MGSRRARSPCGRPSGACTCHLEGACLLSVGSSALHTHLRSSSILHCTACVCVLQVHILEQGSILEGHTRTGSFAEHPRLAICTTCTYIYVIKPPMYRLHCRYIYGLDEASQDQLEKQQRAIVGRCVAGKKCPEVGSLHCLGNGSVLSWAGVWLEGSSSSSPVVGPPLPHPPPWQVAGAQ